MNAVVISPKDDVAVLIEEVKRGESVTFVQNGNNRQLTALDDIKIYHKVALRDIKKDEPVKKYDEHIAVAGRDIKKGEHVHEHNLISKRENLQRR